MQIITPDRLQKICRGFVCGGSKPRPTRKRSYESSLFWRLFNFTVNFALFFYFSVFITCLSKGMRQEKEPFSIHRKRNLTGTQNGLFFIFALYDQAAVFVDSEHGGFVNPCRQADRHLFSNQNRAFSVFLHGTAVF